MAVLDWKCHCPDTRLSLIQIHDSLLQKYPTPKRFCLFLSEIETFKIYNSLEETRTPFSAVACETCLGYR